MCGLFTCYGKQKKPKKQKIKFLISWVLSRGREFESVIVRRMDLESVIQSEISQKEKNKYRILLYMWNLEKWYRGTYLQNINRDTDVENKRMDAKEEGEECGMHWEIGIDI